MAGMAEELGVDPDHVQPAFEDPGEWLLREANLPENVTPENSKLADAEARHRIARVFERGLTAPSGMVLPIQRWQARASSGWMSELWRTRRGKLFLVPGDSPVGFRLPLDSLPHIPKSDYPYTYVADPSTQTGPLPDPDALRDTPTGRPATEGQGKRIGPEISGERSQGTARFTASEPGQDVIEQELNAAGGLVRTAMSVEPRDGRLCIFMPPTERVEDYLELLAAAEVTAAKLGLPVHIEGYAPPHDARMNVIRVAPDPGVLEVNIHPAASWEECVATTNAIYDEARQCRLGADKFMIDGRHTGTGGGNHVTLGGRTPEESPFLRRPDLLGSMLTFWQHHPSLSYLFSGMFIGPTSQAPRVDEARHEALYELEIALSQMPKGDVREPWLVDRLVRNLLTDITGNTHRAEFCVDKMYSPDSATGRLGLLELRGFEMPPHAEMSLMQQLLIRALVARFYQDPYRKPLVRWGTALHDKWMMPHFIWQDLADVLVDLREHGFDFDLAWFAPFLEFRFPMIGEVRYEGTHLSLRQAIEPWHVLGEEASGGGTARYVDSSVERLEVKLTDFNPSRHVLTCNGYKVPLQATGVPGEAVAAVRYRAWQPPSALHPRIKVHAPLVFDLVDTWHQRSMGGCTYHVVHPAGRNYETFPVNANEAEARRMARFWAHGHSHGKVEHIPQAPGQDYPHTLDLRRAGVASTGL